MPDNGSQTGTESDRRADDQVSQCGGTESLGEIAEHDDDRRLASHGAQHVGGPGVAAAPGVDVDSTQLGNDDTEVDAADEIAGDDEKDGGGIHGPESRKRLPRDSPLRCHLSTWGLL